jgi:hypothetical protein
LLIPTVRSIQGGTTITDQKESREDMNGVELFLDLLELWRNSGEVPKTIVGDPGTSTGNR